MRAFLFAFCGLLAAVCCHAQAIPNPRVFERPATDRAFAFSYENDYFSATDEYYTQGLYLLLFSPTLRKNPLSRLLLRPRGWQHNHYLAAEHDAYTAFSIRWDTLQKNYPFSAAIMLKSGVQSLDTAHGRILTTSLSLGLMGPGAGGYEMQYGIHDATGNILPHGWQFQLSNAPIINYEVSLDQRLWQVPRHLLLSGNASARAGTYSIRAGLGGSLMAGIFDDPFRNHAGRRRGLHAYGYASGNAYAIGYSGHLQGGLISGDNIYTVPTEAIRRIVFQSRVGVCLGYGKASLLYFRDMNTREFDGNPPHAYGGLQLLVAW